MTEFGLLRAPRVILFGEGQRRALGRALQKSGTRALICTDPRLMASSDLTAMVDDLAKHGISSKIYGETEAELPLGCIEACVASAKTFDPDIVIGFGGGSCIDLAKLAAVSLRYEGSLRDYYGENLVPGPVPVVVAIPTTSGTGSEVTPVAVLGDPERTLKVGVASPYIVPTIAVCDPELTVSCPPALTASAGADALTHAIEAFTAIVRPRSPDLPFGNVFVGKNSLSDGFALTAITLIGGSLLKAYQNPSDRQARSDMMRGALYAGLAFGVAGTAVAHAIQYPVGAVTHTPHGLGVATLLPYVMEMNRVAIISELAQIAGALGVTKESASEIQNADAAIEAVTRLFVAIGIPQNLKQLGLEQSQCDWVAEQSLGAARLVRNNPVLFDLGKARLVVRAAFDGQITILRDQLMEAQG